MANPYGYPGSYPTRPAYLPGQMIVEPPHLTRDDVEHLNLLRIGYYVTAGLSALAGLFPLIYVGFGVLMAMGALASSAAKGVPPPPFLGWIVVAIGICIFAVIEAMAVLSLLAAKALRERRQRTFIMVIGALHLMHAPLGTLLGIFSLVVLSRPSVQAAFEDNLAAMANERR
jgi:hypothetical protein